MLNKKILAIFAILGIVLLPSAVSAAITITCNPCVVDGCACRITQCEKGIFNAYTTSDCSGVPFGRDIFSNGVKTWYPQQANNHYILILCEDGTRSNCLQQQVLLPGVPPSSSTTTTTGTETETTTLTTTTTTETEATYIPEEKPSGGFNYLWIIVILVIIAAAAFFFLRMRKKTVTYEELYRKWSPH